MLLLLGVLLILWSIPESLLGWRALVRERRTCRSFRNFHTESGYFGMSGAVRMAMGAYLLNLAVYRDWGWMDSTALCLLLGILALITFGMCGLAWFAGTKLAYWIDNRQWPPANYQPRDRY
jgi:hypothetical protein